MHHFEWTLTMWWGHGPLEEELMNTNSIVYNIVFDNINNIINNVTVAAVAAAADGAWGTEGGCVAHLRPTHLSVCSPEQASAFHQQPTQWMHMEVKLPAHTFLQAWASEHRRWAGDPNDLRASPVLSSPIPTSLFTSLIHCSLRARGRDQLVSSSTHLPGASHQSHSSPAHWLG